MVVNTDRQNSWAVSPCLFSTINQVGSLFLSGAALDLHIFTTGERLRWNQSLQRQSLLDLGKQAVAMRPQEPRAG